MLRSNVIDQDTADRTLGLLLNLVGLSKGWSHRRLARELGRDVRSLHRPDASQLPFSVVAGIAAILEWPVDFVADLAVQRQSSQIDMPDDFRQSDDQALQAFLEGRPSELCEIAHHAYTIAKTADEKAIATSREVGGWDMLGHPERMIEASRRGLESGELAPATQLLVTANLASGHLGMRSHTESLALANAVLDGGRSDSSPVVDRSDPLPHRAFVARHQAAYVGAQSSIAMIRAHGVDSEPHAVLARSYLERLSRANEQLCEANPWMAGALEPIRNTCEAGALVADAASGRIDALDAIGEIVAQLEYADKPDTSACNHWLESYGWLCVFGCEIVMKHLHGDERSHSLAILTNKGDELAQRSGNWTILDRIWSIDYGRIRESEQEIGVQVDRAVDLEDIRILIGLMARFPRFRDIGWDLLVRSRVVDSGTL